MKKITNLFAVDSVGARQTCALILLGKIKGTGQVVEIEVDPAQARALLMPTRLSMADVAQRYGKHGRTIRRWVKENRVPHFKIGGAVFFDPAALDRLESMETVHGRGRP